MSKDFMSVLNEDFDIYDKEQLLALNDFEQYHNGEKLKGFFPELEHVLTPYATVETLKDRIYREWIERHTGETMTPKVGVGAFIFQKDTNKLLLGKRLGSHGEGEYSLPGGHIDLGDTSEKTLHKEVKEETNLKVYDVVQLGWADAFFPDADLKGKRQYITLFYMSTTDGEPQNLEPLKNVGWDWYDLSNLPKPLFGGLVSLLGDIKARVKIFEYIGKHEKINY